MIVSKLQYYIQWQKKRNDRVANFLFLIIIGHISASCIYKLKPTDLSFCLMTVHSNFLNRSIIEHSCYVCSWLPAGNLLLFVLIINVWWQVTAACCLQRTKEKRFLTVKWLGKLSFRTTAKTAKWLTESIQIHKKIYHSRDHLEVNLVLKPISPLEFPRALTPTPPKFPIPSVV